MTAPNDNTFDLVPPRRPGTNDFNGLAKVDDDLYPPNPQTQPNAAEWNTIEHLVLAIGRVMPNLILSVSSVPGILSKAGAKKDIAAVSFTVTPNGTGDVSITWPAGTFPTAVAAPIATLNGSTSGQISCEAITNGVRIYTFNATGVAAARAFTLQVF